jgi:serine/threonine-protein kinase
VETAPPKSKTPIYASAIAACILIFALLVYVGGRNLGYFGAPQSFNVPSVTNLPLSQAEQDLAAVGLNYKIKRYYNDSTPGVVFGQSPSNSKVSKGDFITLEVSKGAPTQLVPPVVNKQLVDAETILQKAGFKVTAQGIASSNPAYQVISEFPKPGNTLNTGDTVTITYSDPNASVLVPNLIGLPQATAAYQLGQKNLAVGTITQQQSATIPQGSVISTQPGPNATVDTNTPINLVISSGPSSVTMPLVTGYTQSGALSELQGAPYNFNVTIIDVTTCSTDYGVVVTQSPSGGVSATPGQAVTLQVGVAPGSTTTTSVSSTSTSSPTTTSPTTTTTYGGGNIYCPTV